MNQPYARVNQPYATLTLASALREMFGVQLYKNNARALLSRILSILNLDWLQHARSVRGVYEFGLPLLWPMIAFVTRVDTPEQLSMQSLPVLQHGRSLVDLAVISKLGATLGHHYLKYTHTICKIFKFNREWKHFCEIVQQDTFWNLRIPVVNFIWVLGEKIC